MSARSPLLTYSYFQRILALLPEIGVGIDTLHVRGAQTAPLKRGFLWLGAWERLRVRRSSDGSINSVRPAARKIDTFGGWVFENLNRGGAL